MCRSTLRFGGERGIWRERFESGVLPLFARRTKEVGALLPEVYLHGLAPSARLDCPQSLLRHRPDQDQPPHPPSFNTVMHPPGFHTALLSSFRPERAHQYHFQPQSLLKRLVWRSQWHRLLPPLRLGRPPSLRRGTNPALPGSRQRLASCPWHTFRLDPEHLGGSSRSRDTCSRLVVSNLLPP